MADIRNEKPFFGVSLLSPLNSGGHPSNLAKPSIESMASTFGQPSTPCTPSQEGYDPTASPKPCSPFYSHPRTRTSVEQAKSESKIAIKIYEQDLESGSRILSPEASHQAETAPKAKDECTMWPCKNEQIKQSEARRKRRSRACGPLAGLTKTQKLWLQILLALVIVGAATGMGVGIAKATHTGVYKTQNTQSPIGNGS